jgi:hypothetical protein
MASGEGDKRRSSKNISRRRPTEGKNVVNCIFRFLKNPNASKNHRRSERGYRLSLL